MEAQQLSACATALQAGTTLRQKVLIACVSAIRDAPLRSHPDRAQEAAHIFPVQILALAVRRLMGADAGKLLDA